MMYINDFKENINNPNNIKGFYRLLNPLFLKPINLKECENEILKVKYKPDPSPVKYNQTEFVRFNDSPISKMEDKLSVVNIQILRNKILNVIKRLKIVGQDITIYEAVMKEDLSRAELDQLHNILSGELSGFEGNKFIEDLIVGGCDLAEGTLDGTFEIAGFYPTVPGFADSVRVTMRKRNDLTSSLYTSFQQKVNPGPLGQLFLDVGMCFATSLKNDQKEEIRRAIKVNRNFN